MSTHNPVPESGAKLHVPSPEVSLGGMTEQIAYELRELANRISEQDPFHRGDVGAVDWFSRDVLHRYHAKVPKLQELIEMALSYASEIDAQPSKENDG